MAGNMLNGAQVIVDYLIQEKVPQVFGLCGHGNIQFIDALYERSHEIKTISVHHESVAGFMADVYYRVSGRPTATFTSCGPGSANLPISLANAYLDSVPFMAITGNVPTSQFNRGAFQEMYRHYQADFPSTVRTMCKKVFQPTRGEMVPLAVRQAWKTMVTGRPGPVVIDVPFDVFMEAAAEEAPNAIAWNANISSRCGADPDGVVKAVDMLLSAEQPVIIVGQGVRYGGAAEELKRLAERLQIPVAASASGMGALDSNHPLSLGLVARAGHYQANHATRQADVLLALGVRFDDRTSSSWIPGYSFTIPPTKLIHVDIDPEEIGRNYPVALGLMADVRTFLRQVHAELDRRANLNAKADARKKWLAQIDVLPQGMGQVRRARLHRRHHAGQSAARGARDRQGAAGGCDPRQRHRRASQLAARLLQAEAAGFADRLDGFWPDGLWRRRRARREICRTRSALRLRLRRRRVLHACERAGHRGRIQSARGLGGLEQLRLCLDPRACSAAISAAASWRPTSTIPTPASATIRISRRWRAPAASKACASIAPAIIGEAIRKGIAANKPYLIDVDIAADINPVGAGVWELPGLGQSKAGIGTRFQPA